VSAAALQTPEFTALGSVTSLVGRFGGSRGLHDAVDGLAARIYDIAA
jgi:hypothetical protein